MCGGSANAEEMAKALGGLGLMETGAVALHEQLLGHNTELQVVGGTFAASLSALHQLQHTQAAVTASKQVPAAARTLTLVLAPWCLKATTCHPVAIALVEIAERASRL